MNTKKALDMKIMGIVLGVVVVGLIFLIFLKSQSTLDNKAVRAEYLMVEEKIRSVTETLAFGQIKKVTFTVPEQTKICFMDSRKEKRDLLYRSNDSLLKTYPKIKEIIDPNSDIVRNLIFIDLKTNEIESRVLENICFDAMPFYSCITSEKKSAEIVFEGKGSCTRIWRSSHGGSNSDNPRDPEMYPEPTIFLAWDQGDTYQNWADFLRLIPVTRVQTSTNTVTFSYYVFYNKTDPSSRSVVDFINGTNASQSYIIGPSPISISTNLNLRENIKGKNMTLTLINTSHYFKFWKQYEEIVIYSKENQNYGLRAAMFAVALGADGKNKGVPVIFIDSASEGRLYSNYTINKTVYLFDNRSISKAAKDALNLTINQTRFVDPLDWDVEDDDGNKESGFSYFFLASKIKRQ